MGGWIAVFEDEVEGRLVTVKVYGSDHDDHGNESLPMRAMVTPIDDYEDGPEQGAGLANWHLVSGTQRSFDDLAKRMPSWLVPSLLAAGIAAKRPCSRSMLSPFHEPTVAAQMWPCTPPWTNDEAAPRACHRVGSGGHQ
jgi:hypothetical protein